MGFETETKEKKKKKKKRRRPANRETVAAERRGEGEKRERTREKERKKKESSSDPCIIRQVASCLSVSQVFLRWFDVVVVVLSLQWRQGTSGHLKPFTPLPPRPAKAASSCPRSFFSPLSLSPSERSSSPSPSLCLHACLLQGVKPEEVVVAAAAAWKGGRRAGPEREVCACASVCLSASTSKCRSEWILHFSLYAISRNDDDDI